MGFDSNGVKLFLHAKNKGVDFNKTLTLGRQGIHFLDNVSLNRIIKNFNYVINNQNEILESGYCEKLLSGLGANVIDSIDASAYEKASIIHDLNKPINEELENKYTLVIDAGTLEHVFNFPIAIHNCMRLTSIGGHFLGITHSNNFFGHGLYQFSPEIFYRLFSKRNGFEIVEILIYVNSKTNKFYKFPDPAAIGNRINMVNSYPTSIFILANKIFDTPQLKDLNVYQSDYAEKVWKRKKLKNNQKKSILFNILPPRFRGYLQLLNKYIALNFKGIGYIDYPYIDFIKL